MGLIKHARRVDWLIYAVIKSMTAFVTNKMQILLDPAMV